MAEHLKILIIKMSAIGDVIHTLPALNAIRAHYPHAHITWLIEPAAADIVTEHPALDRVIVLQRKRWMRQFGCGQWTTAVREAASFVRTLRDSRYDMVIDFQGLLKSATMSVLARGARKIGFGKGLEHAEMSYLFYNECIPPVSMEIHALKRGLLFLESMGIPAQKVVYDLPVMPRDRAAIRTLFEAHGISEDRPVFCINPQATWVTKLWDQTQFARLADSLADTYQAHIVFTGGREDARAVEEIRTQMRRQSTNLAGLTTLKTLAALFALADLLVTTDTGPMHLGAAVGTKVVAIFGATAPWRTGPWGATCSVVRAGTPCSPCFKRNCHRIDGKMACMTAISVADVENVVHRRMFGGQSGGDGLKLKL